MSECDQSGCCKTFFNEFFVDAHALGVHCRRDICNDLARDVVSNAHTVEQYQLPSLFSQL